MIDLVPKCLESDHNCKHLYHGYLRLAGQPLIYELLADPSPDLEGLFIFGKKNTSYPRENQTVSSAFGKTAISENNGIGQPGFELVNPPWGTVEAFRALLREVTGAMEYCLSDNARRPDLG